MPLPGTSSASGSADAASRAKSYGSTEYKRLASKAQTPSLSAEGSWLPFDFDGRVFKARTDPFPHTAQFTRVFIALLGPFSACCVCLQSTCLLCLLSAFTRVIHHHDVLR